MRERAGGIRLSIAAEAAPPAAARRLRRVVLPPGERLTAKAVHIRNAIALTVNPATGSVWAGVAERDGLDRGHPYEFFDPISLHPGTVDYGWPHCYENRQPARPGRDCSRMTPPRVVFPAYDTPIGAAFYPAAPKGRGSTD